MPANYTLLEKITVGAAGASSVTFSGIPQTGYTDLVVKMSTRTTTAGFRDLRLSLNGSTTGFTNIYLEGNGATAYSGTAAIRYLGTMPGTNVTASTFTNSELYFPNYTSSNFKSYSLDATGENNATTNYQDLLAGLWSNTAAITSIELAPEPTNNFAQYSTFYLYGVAKLGTTPAISPYATGGDTIMTDGTYWYHTFTSSGTFTPAKGLSCDVLVVAGGGGGAGQPDSGNNAGGGGAGGYLYSASQSFGTSAYTVTIGAGGNGGSAGANNGSQGSNSQIGTLTAAVGGGYGAYNSTGGTGGSGGGTSGSATSGQGYAGGANSADYQGGGGGGAGAAGSGAGNGGAGLNTLSSWFSTTGTGVSGYVAGGGGGGQYFYTTGTRLGGSGGGGNGGGWNGSTIVAPVAGTANTGGGGGGAGSKDGQGAKAGAAGGSGLVIVRYAV